MLIEIKKSLRIKNDQPGTKTKIILSKLCQFYFVLIIPIKL